MKPQSNHHRMLRLLFWESTIKCNLSCAHCRRIEIDRPFKTDLTTMQGRHMIEQLAKIGREQDFMPILIYSGGEPLCRDDIFELIDFAVRQGIRPALATNGTLINRENAYKIKNSGIERVSVSLDGATSEIHNKLRKLKGSFEAAVHGIGCLREAGVPFQVNMTVTRYNVDQLDDIFVLAHKLGAAAVHLFMLVPVGCGEEFSKEDMLSAQEYEKVLEQIARKEHKGDIEIKVTCGPHYERVIREQKIIQPFIEQTAASYSAQQQCPGVLAGPKHGPLSKGCLAGSGVLFIAHDGQVFPCGYLPVRCDNILETPLSQLWQNSPDLEKLRDVRQLKGKCGDCEYQDVCGGCRARAYAATGDYMQAEPMCQYQPRKERRD